MGSTKYPNGKPCHCGCGQPAKRNIGPDGRNRGWCKYAEGHEPPPSLCDPKIRAKATAAFRNAWLKKLPAGSRRIKNVYGRKYWEIKVLGRRRWVLEHRLIVEQRLGRPLKRTEHIHHRDNNGLNNGLHADGKDNLQLLSNKAHRRLHSVLTPPIFCHCECPHCGADLKHIKKRNTRPNKGT